MWLKRVVFDNTTLIVFEKKKYLQLLHDLSMCFLNNAFDELVQNMFVTQIGKHKNKSNSRTH